MADEQAIPLGPDDFPLPMGVEAASGQLLPGFPRKSLEHIDEDPPAVQARGSSDNTDFLAISEVDPNKLDEAGWGILFARNADAAIREALAPLIEHRRKQVPDARLFKVFQGASGYQPDDTVGTWLARFNVGLAIVDPAAGVPLYLLIVGRPTAIPFEFQYLLDAYWSVGRLDFATPAQYRAYAESVIAYETASTVPHRKRVAMFSVKNPGDRATALLMNQVTRPLIEGTATMKPLGERQGFTRQVFVDDEATKENLLSLLRGEASGGPPALLFTGSHGVAFDRADVDQREKQGAILCGNWPGGPVKPAHYFAADDLAAGAKVGGLIHFFFACYGGGCPQFDNYSRRPDGSLKEIAAEPLVARLPQNLLANGALAVVAHIDRAWSYSFQVGRGAAQVQEFRDVMVRVMKGERIGQCTDQFNLRWTILGSELTELQRQQQAIPGQVSDAMLANKWIARDDARNYLTLGDPAVRLRIEDMTA